MSTAGPRSRPLVEMLRLLVVVFAASAGEAVGRATGRDLPVLGPLDAATVGVLLGTAVGYVAGGVLGRSTLATVDRTTSSLRDVSAESLLAGAAGAGAGVVVGGAVAWPVFFVPDPRMSVPLFAFVLLVTAALGQRLALARKREVVDLVGHRHGLSPRPVAALERDRVLDSSVAIDGRLLAVVRSGFLGGRLLVPSFILGELQGLADAADPTRRAKGRRGLETLEALRREPSVDLDVLDVELPAVAEVDAKLVRLCLDDEASLVTLDTNLARAAALAGVAVLNLHSLGLALRPPVGSGDEVTVLLTKPGKEHGQAVGYLDDGTMCVVERARGSVGEERVVRVTSVLTTANGRMVFAEPASRATSAAPSPAVPSPADVARLSTAP